MHRNTNYRQSIRLRSGLSNYAGQKVNTQKQIVFLHTRKKELENKKFILFLITLKNQKPRK